MCRLLELFYLRTPLGPVSIPDTNQMAVPVGGWEEAENLISTIEGLIQHFTTSPLVVLEMRRMLMAANTTV